MTKEQALTEIAAARKEGSRADLSGADLSGADLYGADLSRANLSGASGVPPEWVQRTQIVPQVGAFTVFKKLAGGVVARLLIPETAQRVGGLCGRKCRASGAVVVAFLTTDNTPHGATEAVSMHDERFVYRPGATVTPSNGFSADPFEECAPGIHFFLSFDEARDFSL